VKLVDVLKSGSEKMDLNLDDIAIDRFRKYSDELIEWNKVMNLTSIVDPEEIAVKHFLDSLGCIFEGIGDGNISLIDVGTGAGFPGLPLKIAYDKIALTLLDSLNKRINFLNHVVDELELEDVHCVHGRAEIMGQDEEFREQFDVSVSRAVAELNVLSEYCLPFVKVGGYFISQKSKLVENEIENSKDAIRILGGEIVDVKKVEVPFLDAERYLVVIKKVESTPGKYPRRAGMPTKKPLK